MLSSFLVSTITRVPYFKTEFHNAKVVSHEVFTELMPQDVTVKPEVAPLWIIVLSACAGTLILLLLIFLLWKVCFLHKPLPYFYKKRINFFNNAESFTLYFSSSWDFLSEIDHQMRRKNSL